MGSAFVSPASLFFDEVLVFNVADSGASVDPAPSFVLGLANSADNIFLVTVRVQEEDICDVRGIVCEGKPQLISLIIEEIDEVDHKVHDLAEV